MYNNLGTVPGLPPHFTLEYAAFNEYVIQLDVLLSQIDGQTDRQTDRQLTETSGHSSWRL